MLRPMELYVGITDDEWFNFHSSKSSDELNFWRPSPKPYLKRLQIGAPFLFKLHGSKAPIAGGGFFLKFLVLPLSLAWDTFGEANGATTFERFRKLISKRSTNPIGPKDDPLIGCTILGEPFFLKKAIAIPADFKDSIVSGKSYEMTSGEGLNLWQSVSAQLAAQRADFSQTIGPATQAAIATARYGTPYLVKPRLGQGTFRIDVTEAYEGRCAMTMERTLPALEAAHIHRFSAGGVHEVSNGLLLRSDLHRLFDRGYLAVDPVSYKILVSPRIKEEFENGRDYYALEREGRTLRQPTDPNAFPSRERLTRHYEEVYKKSA